MDPRILTNRLGLLELAYGMRFDLEEFTFDEERREICLYLGYRRKGPYNQRLLKITDISHVEIHDEAQIRIYDLDDVQISTSSIRLMSSTALEIVLTVSGESEIFLLDTYRKDKQHMQKGADSLFKRVRNWFKKESAESPTKPGEL